MKQIAKIKSRINKASASLAAAATVAVMSATPYAFAANEHTKALTDILGVIAKGMQFGGGVLVIFGLIQIGLTIREMQNGGSGSFNAAIFQIVGGVVVGVAGTLLAGIDTSWMNA